MHIPPIRSSVLALTAGLLSLAFLGLLPGSALALPGDPAQLMGSLPGTEMTKEEFRARAYAQLAAVALNAHAYFLVENDFPPSYYDLYNSPAWNIDVSNIFSGRAVDSIEFTPTAQEMTDAPVLGLPVAPMPEAEEDEADTDIIGLMNSGQLNSPMQVDLGALAAAASTQSGQSSARRVNPAAITSKAPGSIYYYTKAGLLQLVMFATDGETYCEFVCEVPNRSWLDALSIKNTGGLSFPDDMFANQVLYYAERILPRHYNMVRFMSSREPLTEPDLKRSGADERMQLARELQITLFNPYRKRAVKVVAEPALGDFLVTPSSPALPLVMTIKNGDAGTLASLGRATPITPEGPAPKPGTKPQPKPGKPKPTPPMGGRGS